MKIKVLGISASPRKGNSLFLLNTAVKSALKENPKYSESEIYTFIGKKMSPCLHCNACKIKGECIIEDDFQDLQNKWISADIIIYSVPVYHMGIPGQLKCFIDRLGQSTIQKYKKEGGYGNPKFLKVIGVISQGMHLFSGQEHATTELINHALIMGSLPVTGDLWESYIGALGWTENRGEKDSIELLQNEGSFDVHSTINACKTIGKRCMQMAIILRSGLKVEREELSQDPAFEFIYKKLDLGDV